MYIHVHIVYASITYPEWLEGSKTLLLPPHWGVSPVWNGVGAGSRGGMGARGGRSSVAWEGGLVRKLEEGEEGRKGRRRRRRK